MYYIFRFRRMYLFKNKNFIKSIPINQKKNLTLFSRLDIFTFFFGNFLIHYGFNKRKSRQFPNFCEVSVLTPRQNFNCLNRNNLSLRTLYRLFPLTVDLYVLEHNLVCPPVVTRNNPVPSPPTPSPSLSRKYPLKLSPLI